MNDRTAPEHAGEYIGEVATLLWAGVVSTSFFTLAPVIIGGLMDQLHLSVRQTGFLSTVQLTGSALGNLLVLLYGRRFSVRWVLVTALGVIAICEFASAFAYHLATLVLWRACSGTAAGVVFATTNAAAARLRRPGGMFAAISIAQMLFGVAGFLVLPRVLAEQGLAPVFVVLGLSAVGCLMMASRCAGTAPRHDSRLRFSLAVTQRSALLILALFATYLATAAVWTYLDRIGVAAGLTSAAISHGLAISMIAGIVGAVIASGLLMRSEVRVAPLLWGAVLVTLSTALLVKASSVAVYWAAVFGFNGALALVTPLYLSTLAADAEGDRQVVLAMLAMYLGFIGGPVLGSDLIARFGYPELIEVGATCLAVAAGLTLGGMRRPLGMVSGAVSPAPGP